MSRNTRRPARIVSSSRQKVMSEYGVTRVGDRDINLGTWLGSEYRHVSTGSLRQEEARSACPRRMGQLNRESRRREGLTL